MLASYSVMLIVIILSYEKIMNVRSQIEFSKDDTENWLLLNRTSCKEFSKFARFNPYSVLNQEWLLIYYWAPHTPYQTVTFQVPSMEQETYLHKILDPYVEKPINWTNRRILMIQKNNFTSLLVEQSDRGEYLTYGVYKGFRRGETLSPVKIVAKQTGDNKLLGMMHCTQHTMYVFAPIDKIPPQSKLQEEVSRLGYFARGGKSYLYQGHEWMPIPEADKEKIDRNKRPLKSAFLNEYLY